jgi:hypothetical protein
MIFIIVNTWLIIALIHFAIAQMHTPAFVSASRLCRRIWFATIFYSVTVLLGTTLPLPVLHFRALCEFLGIEIMDLRTATMGLWLTVYGIIHSRYSSK